MFFLPFPEPPDTSCSAVSDFPVFIAYSTHKTYPRSIDRDDIKNAFIY